MVTPIPRDDSTDIIASLSEAVHNLQNRISIIERLRFSGNLVEIETLISDGTTASFDFQNIPQSYKHLLLVGQARIVEAVNENEINVRLNNDSGSNYHKQLLIGQDASPAAAATANDTEAQIGVAPGANATANYAGQVEAKIINYTGTDLFKQVLSSYTMMRSTTLNTFDVGNWGNTWLSSVAVSRLTVANYSSGNTFVSGTLFTLYGML